MLVFLLYSQIILCFATIFPSLFSGKLSLLETKVTKKDSSKGADAV